MRPDAKLYEQSTKKVMMNGPRPSPLMISKNSHLIRKPSVYSTSNVVIQDTKQQQQRQPIIIYTHSPKIIHTKPQDFMALVQRLTGKSTPSSSREEDAIATTSSSQHHHNHHQMQNREASENFGSSSMSDVSNNSSVQMQRKKSGGSDVDETSSALRRDGGDDEACVNRVSASFQLISPFSLGFADMPQFTPNSSDFFCSSRPAVVFKDSDSPFGILGSLISPSGLEFIKELPEY